MSLDTPVAFLIFKRPDTTERVFQAIREAKPKKLLVVADGGRDSEEQEKCQQARAVIEKVDWDCEVLKNYSETNLGCKQRVSSGLDWVFSQVEEAIILEDDCVPHSSFFQYCQELLERYRDDNRIMHIGGNNFLCSRTNLEYSYYFSSYPHCWGWATWSRAWQYYDINMKLWPLVQDYYSLYEVFYTDEERLRRKNIWEKTYQGKIDTWDYGWFFTIRSQNGMSILPRENLITNIGFGIEGTHTQGSNNRRANLPISGVQFPLIDPPFAMRDSEADYNYEKMHYKPKPTVIGGLKSWIIDRVTHKTIKKIISKKQ